MIRSTPRRRTIGTVAVLVAAIGLATGPARAHGPDPVLGGGLFTQDELLEFRWRAGAEPPAAIKTAIKAAAAGLNGSRASRAATFGYDAGGASPIGYGPGATCGVNGIACFTRSAPDTFTMWLREHGRVFDWGTLKWCQMYADPPNGCYDAQTIALDEFGHIEILGHHVNYDDDRDYLDAVVQTFSRTKPKEGWDEHVLGRCDVATLQRKYDVPDWTTRISTCLDLSTVLTLSASPTSIPYNTATKLTATLKIAGNDAYERLQDNPLSGRTVKLQRRPPGAMTWTTVGTMAVGAGSGTYVTSVFLLTDTEFRAVFATPTNEGINGDNSGTVRVLVDDCMDARCPLSGGR